MFFLTLCTIFTGCSGNEQPVQPQLKTVMSADISGDLSFRYEAPGVISIEQTTDYLALMLSSFTNVNGTKCGLVMTVFYLDKTEKTGTFPFSEISTGHINDYAAAAFEYGEGANKLVFVASSDSVSVSEINGLKVKGLFRFTAKEKNSSKSIQIKNGIINFGS